MELIRSKYEEIRELLEIFPAVAILGARQVGKTTLSLQLPELLDLSYEYIDLESEIDTAKLQEAELFLQERSDKLVIIDEVQRMPSLFPLLRSLIDRNRQPARFLLLGSASPDLMLSSNESLAGRIAYTELSPFQLLETGAENFQKLWARGGFPSSYMAHSERASALWRRNFITTYIERDLPKLGLNVETDLLRKFWKILAHFHGNLFNAANVSRSLSITGPTVKKYLDFLEDAFLCYRVEPFSRNIKKRLVKAPKIYLNDSGLFHTLLGIKDFAALESSPYLGASFEGFVIQQVRSMLPLDYSLGFYRTHEGAECDMLILKNDVPWMACEIKYSNAPRLEKGFTIVTEDLQTAKNYIITPSSDEYPVAENIRTIALYPFLEKLSQEF